MLFNLSDESNIVKQGWGTCGPRKHLIWPASEVSLPKL